APSVAQVRVGVCRRVGRVGREPGDVVGGLRVRSGGRSEGEGRQSDHGEGGDHLANAAGSKGCAHGSAPCPREIRLRALKLLPAATAAKPNRAQGRSTSGYASVHLW